MPTVEKTHGGEVYLRAVDERVATGDRLEVTDGLAAHLCESRGDFDRVDDAGEADEATEDVDDEQTDESDGFDAEAFADRTPMDDVIEDIEAGEADEHLDAVAEAADRVGVQDAVGERRAELESEE